MKPAALLLLLLLPACAAPPQTEADSGRCVRIANDDPAYKADLAKSAGNLDYQWQFNARMQAERNAAIDRCRNGVTGHRGGVERAS